VGNLPEEEFRAAVIELLKLIVFLLMALAAVSMLTG
jgi:hypothetical protein